MRGIAQETAGVADEQTIEAEPPGSGPPTQLRMGVTTAGLTEVMQSPPTELVGDNNSLIKRLQLDVTNKGKALRKMSRLINYVKGTVESGQVAIEIVGTKKMKANPLTKVHSSPTVHWREAEWLMGSSKELDAMKQMAKDGARRAKALAARATSGDADADGCGYEGDDDDQGDATTNTNTEHNATTTEHTETAKQQATEGARAAHRRRRKRPRWPEQVEPAVLDSGTDIEDGAEEAQRRKRPRGKGSRGRITRPRQAGMEEAD
jgi:hypothetical protein